MPQNSDSAILNVVEPQIPGQLPFSDFKTLGDFATLIRQAGYLSTLIPGKVLTTVQALDMGCICIREPKKNVCKGLWLLPADIQPALESIEHIVQKLDIIAKHAKSGLLVPRDKLKGYWAYTSTREVDQYPYPIRVELDVDFNLISFEYLTEIQDKAETIISGVATEVISLINKHRVELTLKCNVLADSEKITQFETELKYKLKSLLTVSAISAFFDSWHKKLDTLINTKGILAVQNITIITQYTFQAPYNSGKAIAWAVSYNGKIAYHAVAGTKFVKLVSQLIQHFEDKLAHTELCFHSPVNGGFALKEAVMRVKPELGTNAYFCPTAENLGDTPLGELAKSTLEQYIREVGLPQSKKSNTAIPNYLVPANLRAEVNTGLQIFTDGSCRDSGGLGAVIMHPDLPKPKLCKSTTITDDSHTIEFRAALFGLKSAIREFPKEEMSLFLDNQGVVALLRRLKEGELSVKHLSPKLRKFIDFDLCHTLGKTSIFWVKGHASCEGNRLADRCAGNASKKPAPNATVAQ